MSPRFIPLKWSRRMQFFVSDKTSMEEMFQRLEGRSSTEPGLKHEDMETPSPQCQQLHSGDPLLLHPRSCLCSLKWQHWWGRGAKEGNQEELKTLSQHTGQLVTSSHRCHNLWQLNLLYITYVHHILSIMSIVVHHWSEIKMFYA